MSNVKAVRISAVVPFNWLDRDESTDTDDAVLFGRLLLTPSIGLTHQFNPVGFRPNPATGGRTAMYRLEIEGHEAISWPYLERLKARLEALGTVELFEVLDAEAEERRTS